MSEDKSKQSFPIVELIWIILFFLFVSIYFPIKYKNLKALREDGIIIQAVIIHLGSGRYSSYAYAFCVQNTLYNKNSISVDLKYKSFIYGDKITIKYLPSNPKINKPMYLLYKKDPEIRKKYEKEFLKKLNKDDPVNEYWNGWNDVLNYQHRFPLHSEYPCLPPWY